MKNSEHDLSATQIEITRLQGEVNALKFAMTFVLGANPELARTVKAAIDSTAPTLDAALVSGLEHMDQASQRVMLGSMRDTLVELAAITSDPNDSAAN